MNVWILMLSLVVGGFAHAAGTPATPAPAAKPGAPTTAARPATAATTRPLVTTSRAPASTMTGGSSSNVRVLIGFSQSAIAVGADYEKRTGDLGVGGYFMYSGEAKNAGKNQTMALGAMTPVHLLSDGRLDTYLAPGFGLLMVKGIAPTSDQTVFGPSWKLGVLFKMTNSASIGLEHVEFLNWFSDKVGPEVTYTNVAVNFGF